MRFGKKKYIDPEFNPDEIFLDASNLPDFNQNSLEGRLEKPITRSTYLGVALVIVLIFTALVAQAANLEITKGATPCLIVTVSRLSRMSRVPTVA
jgi:hypothetical protein